MTTEILGFFSKIKTYFRLEMIMALLYVGLRGHEYYWRPENSQIISIVVNFGPKCFTYFKCLGEN